MANSNIEKSLEQAQREIQKRFGEGALMKMSDVPSLDLDVISTGSLTTDLAVGVGGLPRGRIVEIYGPESSGKTTLCLQVIAEAQKQGLHCAFIDTEHALDMQYAKRLGVKDEMLYVSQPDTGEQALEITETLVRSGGIGAIVVDSVAALVPRAEIEGEMGDAHVGLQARLMSQALRKLAGAVKASNTLLLFTNQLREKVGVMFGCFDYATTVMLEDGSLRSIGKIVNSKEDHRVMSYNTESRKFEPKPIKSWFKNGVDIDVFDMTDNEIGELEQEWVTIIAEYPSNSGHTKFSTTPNHEILTPSGYWHAEDLDLGDEIVIRHLAKKPSCDLDQLILGSVMGDASVRRGGSHTALFREEHSKKQEAYVLWKYAVFNELGLANKHYENEQRASVGFDSKTDFLFKSYKTSLYKDGDKYKQVRSHHIEKLSPFGLAVWYQDDGTRNYQDARRYEIATNTMTDDEAKDCVRAFRDTFGLSATYLLYDSHVRFAFSGEQADAFERIVVPFMHPSMSYKARDKEGIGAKLDSLRFAYEEEWQPLNVKIVELRRRVKRGAKAVRYNIEVADNANYIVGNAVVHNSPETTSGGRALKFYASIRLDIRRISSIKDGSTGFSGNRTRIKVKKNKVAPPFREAEFDIMFNEGVSVAGEIIDLATSMDIVDKRGSYFKYTDKETGEVISLQGREKFRVYLLETPEIALAILNEIRVKSGLKPLDDYPYSRPSDLEAVEMSGDGEYVSDDDDFDGDDD